MKISNTNRRWPLVMPSVAATAVALALALTGCGPHGASSVPMAQAQAQAPSSSPSSQGTGNTGRTIAVARGKVELEGGMLEVGSPADGTVEAVEVAEGQSVKRGQVLVRLAPAVARQDMKLADAEWAAAQARAKAQEQRVAPAHALVARLQEASRAGATDLQRTDEAQQAEREAQAAVAVSQSELAIAGERRAQSRLLLDRLTVRAAQDGVVVRLQTQPGARALTGGAPLLVLMPARPLLVRAELNDSFLADIKAGQHVTVVSDTGTASRAPITGRVRRINPLYGPSRLDEDNPARAGLRVVDCWIEFEQAPPLRVGQDVRVNFYD